MSDGADGPRGHGCARASAQVQEVGTASRLQGKGSENCYMGKFIVLLQMYYYKCQVKSWRNRWVYYDFVMNL